MKTFETEKGNIPDGATHYSEESDDGCFAWYKKIHNTPFLWCVGYEEGWIVMIKPCEFNDESVKPIPQTNIETPEEKEALDLIDTTPRQYESVASKEAEWVNGELLEFNGEPCIFIGMSEGFPVVKYTNDADSTLSGEIDEIFATDMLSKPEAEAERVERERLEAAEDLYITYMSKWEFAQDWRALDEINKSAFLAIVDKTNYRKESE